ncbi:hypothetical protein H181DRAFT_03143 [Streptomyces sp. WMMB 714]|uniref:hypothetical protein n=1 Tax=Streptomyces sp. WMMB 714 TaxID=1286822 RepID=UPI0005F876D0|nr:hypothetical protein [Streptomyces sp. WMMB 714]SCK37194.1 hypothetical protein H181DRAFT_03143 [Streptomyces sp. WMMB 714]
MSTPQEQAAAADRNWFQRHPGADHYYRELIPGEAGAGIYRVGGRTRVRRDGRDVPAMPLDHPQAADAVRSGLWTLWAPPGTEVPAAVREAADWAADPLNAATLAVLDAEDAITKEAGGDTA